MPDLEKDDYRQLFPDPVALSLRTEGQAGVLNNWEGVASWSIESGWLRMEFLGGLREAVRLDSAVERISAIPSPTCGSTFEMDDRCLVNRGGHVCNQPPEVCREGRIVSERHICRCGAAWKS